MEAHVFHFVGGSQDGRSLVVPDPITPDMEFLVRPAEPYLPWEPYLLGDDGRFHYVELGSTRTVHAPAGDAPAGQA
jgi:hypothetical protein